MMTQITVHLGGEHGEPKRFDVAAGEDGALRVVDPDGGQYDDAVWVADDIDDLAAQINADGHWLDGYLD